MKAGDKVVYVMRSIPAYSLVNGKIYTVRETYDCGGCADGLCIDVGLPQPMDGKFSICGSCMNIISMEDTTALHHSGFRLLDSVEGNECNTEYHLQKIKNLQKQLHKL